MIKLHTKESAPEQSKPILEEVEKGYGFIPNTYLAMAESPLALATYAKVNGLISELSAFSPQEQQLLMVALSVGNDCEYCVAAHSTVAAMTKAPEDAVEAIRQKKEPQDPKIAALVRFAQSVQEKRGWVSEADHKAFLDAGYTARHVLDILAILALKTVSNYTNHMVNTPLDEQFAERKWSRGE